MPAGVSWPRYIAFSTAAFLSMALGSQTVHHYFKPLENLDYLVDQELARLKHERDKQKKIKD